LETWFKSGVVGVGLGSKLISDGMLEDKDYHSLRVKTEKAMSIVSEMR
jgi:2-dehydro-3-deoxyphosphogluconate aldolase/(4S)-4-hydroxy-2-oxoglutarate aldolase